MSHAGYRRVMLICGVLFALVALLVALVIVPAVDADISQNAQPGRAITAFRVNVGLKLFLAFACVSFANWLKAGRAAAKIFFAVIAIIALLLGLALTDAAMAFRSHELIMRGTPAVLLGCAALDLVVGAVVLFAVFRLPRK